MGGQISIHCGCCSGKTEGNENFDEEVEDKINVGENVKNYDDPQIKMPALHRSWSETTLPVR